MQYKTKLEVKEAQKRLERLDILRVLLEGHDEGTGYDIWKKACRALDNTENFTGIIRLTFTEKDYLSYVYCEDEFLSEEEDEVLRFYLKEHIDPDMEEEREAVKFRKRYENK